MKPFRKLAVNRYTPYYLPVLAVAVWQLLGQYGYISTRTLPTPLQVAEAGISLAKSGEIFQYIYDSAKRAFIGLVIGGGIGFVLGVVNGLFPIANRYLDSSLQMIRNVPHLALIPLVILWFGIDETAKIFLVALGVFFPIYMNTVHGIRSIDPGLIEMAKVYELKGFAFYREVILPGALSSVLVGLRYALGFMWLTLIVAETISANSGIGYMAMNAREFMRLDIVVFAIILYAILGKLSDSAAKLMERRLLRWNPNYTKS
ncbi:aliphatic sulfonate ABC transporter permease SsuC [Cohnella thailandensis]|uniref:Aliphatic sulfonate ABC transporter permease SsuC n=1 Tax=Cohnella thailandensis TaxID=557557 RepID=A0A841SS40_9BACL|nr:aliphatic sulfonate ABC transporter permease SsuC [Cohnella thailandensis]MBB6633018.1 aliphatic sulfonate ABC transporter permease SsuC [Cohnella thailandensis]MBP1975287.1 sulfonate transport system permease protein [Cohnella thailandensis]